MTYLIVSRYKLGDRMENFRPRELMWPGNSFKVQLLLELLLRQSSTCYGCLFFLHDLPDITRYCPMIHRYVLFFTFLLVKIVMLTNVCMTG